MSKLSLQWVNFLIKLFSFIITNVRTLVGLIPMTISRAGVIGGTIVDLCVLVVVILLIILWLILIIVVIVAVVIIVVSILLVLIITVLLFLLVVCWVSLLLLFLYFHFFFINLAFQHHLEDWEVLTCRGTFWFGWLLSLLVLKVISHDVFPKINSWDWLINISKVLLLLLFLLWHIIKVKILEIDFKFLKFVVFW